MLIPLSPKTFRYEVANRTSRLLKWLGRMRGKMILRRLAFRDGKIASKIVHPQTRVT